MSKPRKHSGIEGPFRILVGTLVFAAALVVTRAARAGDGGGTDSGGQDSGHDSGHDAGHDASAVSTGMIEIMPISATVAPGATQQFIASGGSPPYTWSLTLDGSGPSAQITAMGGLYTAGAIDGMDAVTVTDSAADQATAMITVAVVKVGIGAMCMSSDTCPSGATCVDGVCCTTGCGGQCQACNTAGNVGTCVTIKGPPVGTRAACAQSDPNNVCTSKVCDGTSPTACTSLVGPSTTCGVPSCVDGIGTPGAVCMGDGTCQKVAPASCGVYACVSDQCATKCIDDAECSPGNYCNVTSGKCIHQVVPDGGVGATSGATPLASSSGCSLVGSPSPARPALMLAALLGSFGVWRGRRRRRP